MIEGYYEFDSRKMEIEFPVISRLGERVESFNPYFKHIDGEFIEEIKGKGDAFSYVSGQSIQIINVELENEKNGELISFKMHQHWHKIIFEEVVNEFLPKILKRHQQLENGKMYSSEVVFAGKIFKFIDENANTFRFFAYLAEWADCYPIYIGILPRLSSIIKSYYYNKGELEHWEYLKGLNFRDVRVNMI